MTTLTTTDPATGVVRYTGILETTADEVAHAAERAAAALPELARLGRPWRAGLLRSFAQETEASRELLVATAAEETGLATARLNTELTRCVLQFHLFADAILEGSYLEAAIDHRADTPLVPAPEIRRYLRAIGPVAVFGASNFPFAFSVLGGDTASAVAAGCPVVVKAHGSHPLTSDASFAALSRAAAASGAPDGTLSIVYGQDAGARLVQEPAVKAVAFTGSLETGKVLTALIAERPEPIPIYGELSSVNPVVVSEGALAECGAQIADAAAASILGSGGQLCTKPGVFFVPAGSLGDEFVARLAAAVSQAPAHPALNARVLELYRAAEHHLGDAPGVGTVARSEPGERAGSWFPAAVLATRAADLTPESIEEAFGPLALVVQHDSEPELLAALELVPPSLTATVHLAGAEHARSHHLVEALERRSGRIVFDGFPTGVRVSWAQHHGGPWPATNSLHSSVGVTSLRRFLAPIAFQDAPTDFLPLELRDDYAEIPRRIDGVLHLPHHRNPDRKR